MISIFSDYLTPLNGNCEEIKPSDIYCRLRIAYNQGVKGILDNTRLICSGTTDEFDYDTLYEVWNNNDLHNVITWINKKILLELGQLDYRAIDVRTRIATSMLNKLVKEGKLSNNQNIIIHNRLVSNLKREMSAINTEDLPF